MLKITHYEEDGDFIRIKTNASDRDFVYKKDKFQDVDQLKQEIAKSIAIQTKKDTLKANRIAKLKEQLNKEVNP